MKSNLLTGLAVANKTALWGNMEVIPLLDRLSHRCNGHSCRHVIEWHSMEVAINMPLQSNRTPDLDMITRRGLSTTPFLALRNGYNKVLKSR